MDNKGIDDLSNSLEERNGDHGKEISIGEEHEIRVGENEVFYEQCNVENSSSNDEFNNATVNKDGGSADREVEHRHTLRQSSNPEISANPTTRGLDHCITAPAGGINTQRHLFVDNNEIRTSRCKSENDSRRLDRKLDRLSQRDKWQYILVAYLHHLPTLSYDFVFLYEEKLIANLVKIQKDGTVEVDLDKNAPVASELFELHSVESASYRCDEFVPNYNKPIPILQIAILVVGTRGDVQPFLAMAKRLQEFGHRVRLATHTNFKEFVRSAGVEFYPLGGDPRVLAGYMARNKGLIPSGPGEISIQRRQLKSIIETLLPSCIEPDIETGAPFRAQAIVANPPAYGHVHVAEALGIPLHIFFTMPWTPTYEFPHPLARVPQSYGNWLSYIIVDLLIWWGIRSYINDFRKRKLKLPPIAYFSMYHGSISHLPTGYMWSPQIVPKPKDWGPLVDVVGYCFLNLGSKYHPKGEFVEWMKKGKEPVYIGFGSMPLEDPRKTTSIIIEALKDTGQRGILDRGWGDLGVFSEVPDHIFLLENCPHDWLFPQCSAVVHHGGAGTTATGLRAGCPTTIVPFFGDQFFWGDRIHQKGLGPEPIPVAQLSVDALSSAIRFMLQPEVKARVTELAKLIENEDGVAAAVDAFHRHLPHEMPSPASLDPKEDENLNPIQWFFSQIGIFCGRVCS